MHVQTLAVELSCSWRYSIGHYYSVQGTEYRKKYLPHHLTLLARLGTFLSTHLLSPAKTPMYVLLHVWETSSRSSISSSSQAVFIHQHYVAGGTHKFGCPAICC